jgi:hypothetical protein
MAADAPELWLVNQRRENWPAIGWCAAGGGFLLLTMLAAPPGPVSRARPTMITWTDGTCLRCGRRTSRPTSWPHWQRLIRRTTRTTMMMNASQPPRSKPQQKRVALNRSFVKNCMAMPRMREKNAVVSTLAQRGMEANNDRPIRRTIGRSTAVQQTNNAVRDSMAAVFADAQRDRLSHNSCFRCGTS